MIRKVDHIGIAVRSLERGLEFWAESLGLEVEGIETVESEGVKVAMLPAGESQIELLEPLGDDSTIGRFIEKRGEGLHHLTLGVGDLEGVLERLQQHGAKLIGEAPRPGAGGSRIAFVHPRSTGGVLLELVERKDVATDARPSGLAPGSAVLAYLRDPQEKLWGMLRKLDSAGFVLHGIDLGSFDDWVAQIERHEESVVGPSVLFVPMSRVEKILLDRSSGDLPSLAQRFQDRTGSTLQQVLTATGPDERTES